MPRSEGIEVRSMSWSEDIYVCSVWLLREDLQAAVVSYVPDLQVAVVSYVPELHSFFPVFFVQVLGCFDHALICLTTDVLRVCTTGKCSSVFVESLESFCQGVQTLCLVFRAWSLRWLSSNSFFQLGL